MNQTIELLNVNEAMLQMDKMINNSYRSWIGNEIKEYSTLEQWFDAYGSQELNIDTNKGYLDIFGAKKSIIVSLKDKQTNKPVKKLYFNKDVTSDFTLAYDGMYYNEAWSKSGNKIDVDGLGWTIEQVREYMLMYEVIRDISDRIEGLKDSVREYFIN